MPRTVKMIIDDLSYEAVADAIGADRIRMDDDDIIIDNADLEEREKIHALRMGATHTDEAEIEEASTTNNQKGGPRRVVVEAGTVTRGSEIGGRVVTGLGRIWRADEDASSLYGVSPLADHIQYAYFD